MIISKLIGGLGNQMFQYAIGRYLSYKNKCQFKLDTRGFERYKLHEYNLHYFKISADIATNKDLKKNWKNLSALNRNDDYDEDCSQIKDVSF